MKEFSEKVTLITGAFEGIGFEIAKKFAENGSDIVLCDINENVFQKAEELACSFGIKAIGLKGNVAIEEDVKRIVNAAIEKFSKIDILVNNAGITRDNLVLKMSEKDFTDVIDINLKGPFLMIKYVFPYMSKQRYGKIINISSIVGLCGQEGQANYSSSKAGLIGLTKSCAREFARRNINVNAVAPGFIKTKMTDKLDDRIKEDIISKIPLKRFGLPEEVAEVVLFLASDRSSYITGQVISVNGGLYM